MCDFYHFACFLKYIFGIVIMQKTMFLRSGNSRRFLCLFSGTFFFGKEKINRFEFLICYYSHLKDTEKKFFEEI